VQHIGDDVGVQQQIAAIGRLALALGRKIHIHPSGEQVLGVPNTLAMP